jgi:hypothetical protein
MFSIPVRKSLVFANVPVTSMLSPIWLRVAELVVFAVVATGATTGVGFWTWIARRVTPEDLASAFSERNRAGSCGDCGILARIAAT